MTARHEATDLAIATLQNIRKRPGMWASTCEGFTGFVCGILLLEGRCSARPFAMRDFNQFLRPDGPILRGVRDPVTDVWAHKVIDAALAHLLKDG